MGLSRAAAPYVSVPLNCVLQLTPSAFSCEEKVRVVCVVWCGVVWCGGVVLICVAMCGVVMWCSAWCGVLCSAMCGVECLLVLVV